MNTRFSNDNRIECGCDEVGRGCIAGPLFAAAVILPPDYFHPEINDSKQLSRRKREILRSEIEKEALAFAVVDISAEIIDEINILNASFLGMNKAVMALSMRPELLLIDGNRFKNQTEIPYECIVKGDSKFLSIAAASILAKTYRDELMGKLDVDFPAYDWKNNMGYPTPAHQKAISEHGRCIHHRKSFQLKNQLRLEFE